MSPTQGTFIGCCTSRPTMRVCGSIWVRARTPSRHEPKRSRPARWRCIAWLWMSAPDRAHPAKTRTPRRWADDVQPLHAEGLGGNRTRMACRRAQPARVAERDVPARAGAFHTPCARRCGLLARAGRRAAGIDSVVREEPKLKYPTNNARSEELANKASYDDDERGCASANEPHAQAEPEGRPR